MSRWYEVKVIQRLHVWADSAREAERIASEAPHMRSVLDVRKAEVDDRDDNHQVLNLRRNVPLRSVV